MPTHRGLSAMPWHFWYTGGLGHCRSASRRERSFLRDNSFIIREVSLAENLGPVTESLSYWMGVATHSTGWCVYSDLPPGPAPSGHVAVCVRE